MEKNIRTKCWWIYIFVSVRLTTFPAGSRKCRGLVLQTAKQTLEHRFIQQQCVVVIENLRFSLNICSKIKSGQLAKSLEIEVQTFFYSGDIVCDRRTNFCKIPMIILLDCASSQLWTIKHRITYDICTWLIYSSFPFITFSARSPCLQLNKKWNRLKTFKWNQRKKIEKFFHEESAFFRIVSAECSRSKKMTFFIVSECIIPVLWTLN